MIYRFVVIFGTLQACVAQTDPCSSRPCGTGVCEPSPSGTNFVCSCPDGSGYRGTRCEINIDECQETTDICNSNGECEDSVGSFTCTCNEGFSGPRCEVSGSGEASSGDGAALGTPVIIGIAVGGVALICVIALVVCRMKKSKAKKQTLQRQQQMSAVMSGSQLRMQSMSGSQMNIGSQMNMRGSQMNMGGSQMNMGGSQMNLGQQGSHASLASMGSVASMHGPPMGMAPMQRPMAPMQRPMAPMQMQRPMAPMQQQMAPMHPQMGPMQPQMAPMHPQMPQQPMMGQMGGGHPMGYHGPRY